MNMGMLQMILAAGVATLIVVAGVGTSAAVGGSPRNHCPDRCGDVLVPYPWGVGDDCALSSSYRLTCKDSFSPNKPFLGSFEVLNITISSGKIRVLTNISYECYNSSGKQASSSRWDDLKENPYAFSQEDNVFTAIGCDTLALIQGQRGQNYTGGCLTICDSYGGVQEDGSCSGIGCCQTTIPRGLKKYQIGLSGFNNHSGILDFNPCSYGSLVEKSNYTFHRSDLKEMSRDRQFPVIWDWYIGNQSCKIAQRRSDYACVSANSSCFNSHNGPGYICNCSIGYHGNPFLPHGCQDINECEDPKTYPCSGNCLNTPGAFQCICPDGTTGDPFTFGCRENDSSKRLRSVVISSVAVLSSLLAMLVCIWIFSIIQLKKTRDHNDRCFRDNGGLLLKDKFSSIDGIEDTFTIFTRKEIEKATKNYDPSLVLGRGGEGTVYKGILPPSRTVAIKKAHKVDESKLREFVNEVVILSQIEHGNVVKLVGCCLEVEEPLLVYEFIPNGDLVHHIQSGGLSWNERLKVAAGTAGALAHLHSEIQVQVVHRDVKSSNILLDYGFTAKVADFGASVLVPDSKFLVTALVKGTMGYLDPEYMQTQNLTDKSDVYSFGVVLVELLSGKEPLSSSLPDPQEERCLARRFISCMRAGRLGEMLDPRLATDSEVVKQMEEVASLAMRCLNMRGEDRPPMSEVAGELEGIWRSVSHPWASQYNEEEGQSLLGPPLSRDNCSSNYCSGEKLGLMPREIGR